MYETALENSASKRKVVEQLMAEYRAGKIPEVPEQHCSRSPATGKRAAAGNPKPASKAGGISKGKAILNSFRSTAAKAEANIKELTRKVAALDVEITRLQMKDTLRNMPDIERKKRERADLVKRISALHDIRTRCLKQVGA